MTTCNWSHHIDSRAGWCDVHSSRWIQGDAACLAIVDSPRCESGWTGDRCALPLDHEGPHDNEDGPVDSEPVYTEIRTDASGAVVDSRTTTESGRVISDWADQRAAAESDHLLGEHVEHDPDCPTCRETRRAEALAVGIDLSELDRALYGDSPADGPTIEGVTPPNERSRECRVCGVVDRADALDRLGRCSDCSDVRETGDPAESTERRLPFLLLRLTEYGFPGARRLEAEYISLDIGEGELDLAFDALDAPNVESIHIIETGEGYWS